ncbi:MAG: hypothetical protein GOVbin1923_50 [Prokaryotic dsDNA virus sp.]|nr:MAG: hypothetical protein GOVbin1923_50 [Prokaryotic dsDNA virus sp.]|tara:strand:- start:1224 stop:2264 length:1041 start_codon:yes stop_codon:yes gene_type:complete
MHHLDMSNGRANMFYTGPVPWHGLGKGVENALTAEEAIVAAGLDWNVGLQKMFADYDKTGEHIEIPNNFAVVRDDTKAVLGVVGNQYTCFQNAQAMTLLDEVAGPGRMVHYHTAGSLYGGKRVWLLAKLTNLTIEPVPNDRVDLYIVLMKGHDGKFGVKVFFTPVRVVCANTMGAALSMARSDHSAMVKLKHRKNIFSKADEARKILGLAYEQGERWSDMMNNLAKMQVDTKGWEFLLDNIMPLPELADGEETTRAFTLATNRREKLTELFEGGLGTDIPGVRGTAWGAYNAVTEFTTHHASVRAGVSKDSPDYDRARSERLLDSSWFGSGAKLNQRALDLLVLPF